MFVHFQGYLSASFTCSLEVEGYINQQLSQLRHAYLQDINDIRFLQHQEKRQVAIVQPYWERGSLKDLIYKVRWIGMVGLLDKGQPI